MVDCQSEMWAGTYYICVYKHKNSQENLPRRQKYCEQFPAIQYCMDEVLLYMYIH